MIISLIIRTLGNNMHSAVHQRLIDHFDKLKDHPSEISKHNIELLVPSIIWELLENQTTLKNMLQLDIEDCSFFDHFKEDELTLIQDKLGFVSIDKEEIRKYLNDFLSLMNGIIQSDIPRIRRAAEKFGATSEELNPEKLANLKEELIAGFEDFIRIMEMDSLQSNFFEPRLNTEEKVARYAELHFEMLQYKDVNRPIIEAARLDGQHGIIDEFTAARKTVTLVQNSDGIGGSYFGEVEGERVYVIKPVDEEIGAFNNRKGFSGTQSIFADIATNDTPAYLAPINDMMMYDLACMIGASNNVPETAMMIVHDDGFHDAFNSKSDEVKKQALEAGAGPDNEKLCTVQRFVENSKPVFEVWQDLHVAGVSKEDMGAYFDQDDFENVNILMWLSNEKDGHMGNILATVKGLDEKGQKQFGLVKIDSTYSFPKKNSYLYNALTTLPNADEKLSQKALDRIENIDASQVLQRMKELGYSQSNQTSMLERIVCLKEIAKQGLSIYALNAKMQRVPTLSMELPQEEISHNLITQPIAVMA